MAARSPPKPVTAASLEASALFYLERFASSAANLRRVLLRRVQRSAALHGTDPDAGTLLVDALVGRLLVNGLLDDRNYAAAKSASLRRRGASARAIAAKLASQGVERGLIQAALADADADAPRDTGDLAAAAALARRRRLGPFRPPDLRDAWRLKDLAAFARAGFSRSVAEQILRAADPTELAALVAPER
jgi:regulatory protein